MELHRAARGASRGHRDLHGSGGPVNSIPIHFTVLGERNPMNVTRRSFSRAFLHSALALAVFCAAGATFAASSDSEKREPISSEMMAVKVLKDARGNEVFVDATEAKPGDLLEYRVRYTNHTRSHINGLKATLPLPIGIAYLPSSAAPRRVTASTDQQTFDTVPLRRVIRSANGSRQVKKVPYEEYRALRWDLGKLKAGETTMVKARARVSAN